MPPKVKIPQNKILDAAFEITRSEGFSAVNARSIAAYLHCSTQPIYRVYQNMGELKRELYEKAKSYFATQMYQPIKDMPIFLSMGLRYVMLAKEEPNLFQFLSMGNNFSMTSIWDMVQDVNHSDVVIGIDGMDDFSQKQMAELFMMTWLFTHGIASMVATNTVAFKEEEIIQLLTKAYRSFAFGRRISDED